jgi:hypothetical protein
LRLLRDYRGNCLGNRIEVIQGEEVVVVKRLGGCTSVKVAVLLDGLMQEVNRDQTLVRLGRWGQGTWLRGEGWLRGRLDVLSSLPRGINRARPLKRLVQSRC